MKMNVTTESKCTQGMLQRCYDRQVIGRRFAWQSLYAIELPSCFFFSSRRRHTSSNRDWSSDVCSSDLIGRISIAQATAAFEEQIAALLEGGARSEERRVGTECRTRWSPDHKQKKTA